MSQRVLSSEHVPQTEEEDFGGDVEDIFTRESREIGVEFVRLLLGDVPPASKGPGDGQQGMAARSADERSSDCRSPSAVNVISILCSALYVCIDLHVHVVQYVCE